MKAVSRPGEFSGTELGRPNPLPETRLELSLSVHLRLLFRNLTATLPTVPFASNTQIGGPGVDDNFSSVGRGYLRLLFNCGSSRFLPVSPMRFF